MEEKPSSKALDFEGAKVFLKQDGRGFVLSILIHPNDLHKDLITAPMGTRYMVAMVELADDGTAVAPKARSDGEKILASAVMLCKNPRFCDWLKKKRVIDEATEEKASNYIKQACGIESRSELKNDSGAQEAFMSIRSSFSEAVRRGAA